MDVIISKDDQYTILYIDRGKIILEEKLNEIKFRYSFSSAYSFSYINDDISVLKTRKIYYDRKNSLDEAHLCYKAYLEIIGA